MLNAIIFRPLFSGRRFRAIVTLFLLWICCAAGSSDNSNQNEEDSPLMIATAIPTVPLRNGVQVPVISLGTAHAILHEPSSDDDATAHLQKQFRGFLPERNYRQVELALQVGMRSFEMGRIYRSHRPVGHVLGEWFRQGLLKRQEVFLITKVFHGSAEGIATRNSHMYNLDDLTVDEVTTAVKQEAEDLLVDLGVGYVDLLLLHWPSSALDKVDNPASCISSNQDSIARQRRLAAWKVLENFYERGWARAIGVSNFSEHHLEQLRQDGAKILPMVNQIEASLSVVYPKIVDYCQKHGILLQAFSPFKRGQLDSIHSSSDVLDSMARKYKKTLAQISLRYLYQKGYAMTFLTTNEERMVSNCDIFDFEIEPDDMQVLSTFPREDGTWGLPSPYTLE